jgi:hypothetical protein
MTLHPPHPPPNLRRVHRWSTQAVFLFLAQLPLSLSHTHSKGVRLSVHSPRAFCNHTAESITSIFYVNWRVNYNPGKNFRAIWPISTAQKLHEVNGYTSLYLRIKKVYYSLEWGIVWLIFHKNVWHMWLFRVIHQVASAAILMISAIRAILNFRGPSNPELYGNSRTVSGDSQVRFGVCAVDVLADKKQQIQTIRTQFIIHINHIVIGDIIASNLMYIFISILRNYIYDYFVIVWLQFCGMFFEAENSDPDSAVMFCWIK